MKMFQPGTMRVPKLKNMLIVAMVAIGFYSFFKLNNYFGRFTGEVANDDRMVVKQGDIFKGSATPQTVTVGGKEYTLYIPDQDTYVFDTEVTDQVMNLGNPVENEYVVGFRLEVGERELYQTALYKPGEGLKTVPTSAYFKPGTYEGTVTYEFYYQPKDVVLRPMIEIEKPITIVAEGSGEKYTEGITKNEEKDKKNK